MAPRTVRSALGIGAALGAVVSLAAPAAAVPLTISFTIATPGDITVTNTDDNVGPGDAVTITGTGSLISTGGGIRIDSADAIVLQPGSVVSATAGTVRLDAGASGVDLDLAAGITVAGTARAAGPVTATAGPGNDTVTIDFPAGANLPSGLDVDGGPGSDTLDVDTATTVGPLLTISSAAGGSLSGSYAFTDRPSITFAGFESLTTAPDLAVTNTDGQDTLVAGSPVTFTVVASNTGAVGLAGVSVVDDLPAALTDVAWTCTATAGSSCGAGTGTGDLAETVIIAAGGAVTYTIAAMVDPAFVGTLTTTATVAPPAGVTDPVAGNDDAVDGTTVTAPPDEGLAVAFLAPLHASTADHLVVNDIKAGRVVPVKVDLGGAPVDGPLAVTVTAADCATGAPTDTTVRHAGTLRWSPDPGLWIHNLDTRALRLQRGSCSRVDVHLAGQVLTDDTWVVLRAR